MRGGRGCVAEGTLIYDPIAGQQVSVEDRKEDGWVLTLNGPRPASASYLKGTAPLYRVETETGDAAVVTSQHQFLTPMGWVRLAEIEAGGVIASSDLSTSPEGDRRSMDKPGGLTTCYRSCSRCGGLLPLLGLADGQVPLRQPNDALTHNGCDEHKDDLELRPVCSRLCPRCVHHERRSSGRAELLRVGEEFQQQPFAYAQLRKVPQVSQLSHELSGRVPVSCAPHPVEQQSLVSNPDCRNSPGLEPPLPVDDEQSFAPKLHTDQLACTDSLRPRSQCESPRLGYPTWTRIVAKVPVGTGAFYDLTVPGEEHYFAAGLWHHNSGKTRTGAETLASWVLNSPPGDWAVVAPTYGAARDVCVEGPNSGLLAVLGSAVETWNRSMGELRIHNGARIHIDGADDGALRIQGKNLCGVWADEVGLWQQWDRAWHESITFAVRIAPARIIATGTPKGRTGIPRLLLDDPDVPVTRLRTADNEANLHAPVLARLKERYAGTRLGRQELEGDLLKEVEGALWTWDLIEATRVTQPPDSSRIVVAIDPAATSSKDSDETGIVVAGLGEDRQGYVLADRSGRFSPNEWAERAIHAFDEFGADRIVAERNQGGDMVKATLQTVRPDIPITLVWASRGKHTRAEPVAALYEQGRVHHVGAFPRLEEQLTSWTPQDGGSPDRLDALVWAITELMLSRRKAPNIGPVSLKGQSSWR